MSSIPLPVCFFWNSPLSTRQTSVDYIDICINYVRTTEVEVELIHDLATTTQVQVPINIFQLFSVASSLSHMV